MSKLIIPTAAAFLFPGMVSLWAPQTPPLRAVDEKVLRDYAGDYQGSRAEPQVFYYKE
jgi:hypothetical protein